MHPGAVSAYIREGVLIMPRVGLSILCAGLMAVSTAAPSQQTWPNKPIRIVTAEAGGGGDVVSRIVGQGLTPSLGQQIVVDNRAGNIVIQAEIVSKAPPDGYTLFVSGNTFWILPLLQPVPYDPIRDYAPITVTTSSPAVLAVSPGLPANSVKDVIALAKAKPGALNYASGVVGSTTHLASELFKSMAGIDVVRVSYKGAGSAVTAVLAGEVQMMFIPLSTGAPFVKSGRLRALAVASAQPSALAPGLPTVAASGVPGYESATLHAVFAPAGTPQALINRLHQEIVRYISRPDAKDKLFNAGLEIVGSSPEQSAVTIKAEMARLGKVIKDARIRVD
jgi:tripartite-type tricarboxylate transporter receptor subunit TctC